MGVKKQELSKIAEEIGAVHPSSEKVDVTKKASEFFGEFEMRRSLFQIQNKLAFFIIFIFAIAILVPLYLFLRKALNGSPPNCEAYCVEEIGKFLDHLTSFALKVFMPIITLVLGFYYGKKTN